MTAFVLAMGIVMMIMLLPPPVFSLSLAVITVLAGWEWAGCAGLQSRFQKIAYLLVLSVCVGLCFVALSRGNDSLIPLVFVVSLCWWMIAAVMVVAYQCGKSLLPTSSFLKAFIGLLVLVPAWLSMSNIHALEKGPQQLLCLLLLIWLADSMAYFCGKHFGKQKLAPRVSPGKSWVGACAAILAAVPFGFLYVWWLDKPMTQLGILLVLGVVTVAISILGDLTESMFKRAANIKDSGALLPGHGGILDRVDSLSSAAPLFATGLWLSGTLSPGFQQLPALPL